MLFASDFNGKVLLKVNGHEHYIDDVFGREFIKAYRKDNNAMAEEMKV